MSIEDTIKALEHAYGKFGVNDATPSAELDACERRLGIFLPRALRTIYSRTGRSASLHQRNNVIRTPERLEVRQGHLIFYEEAQMACQWGVAVAALSSDDPMVRVSYADKRGGMQWADEFASMSEFFGVQGAWQAIHGGLPFVGVVTPTEVAGIGLVPPRIDGARVREAALRSGDEFVTSRATRGWIVCESVFAMASDIEFGLAARDAARFRAAGAELGIPIDDWDYATLRDEDVEA